MKKTIFTSFTLLLTLTLTAQSVIWSKALTSTDRDGIWDTQVAPNGDFVALGFFEGDIDLDGLTLAHEGGQEFFLANYSADGNLQWANAFTGPGFDRGDRLAFDQNGNIYLGGVFAETLNFSGTSVSNGGSNDIFLAKYDSDGELEWDNQFGGDASDICYGVYVDDTEMLAVGHFNGTVDFGFGEVTSEGQQDMWLMSLNKLNGQPNWVKTFGGEGQDRLYNVTKDPQGNILVCGYFSSTLEIGAQTLESDAGYDIFLAKLDATGDPIWALAGNSGGSADQASDVLTDDQGNVYLSSYYTEEVDFDGNILTGGTDQESSVISLTPNGDWRWGKTTITDDGTFAARLTLVNDTYLYQGTTIYNGTLFDGTVVSNLSENGVMVTGFDLDGNVINYLIHDGPMDDYALPIGNNGHDLFYGGGFEDEVQVGSQTLEGEGGQDVFITRVDPEVPSSIIEPGSLPLNELAQVRLDMAERIMYVDILHPAIQTATIFDLHGQVLETRKAAPGLQFSLAAFPAAPFVLHLSGNGVHGGQVILVY